MNSNPTHVGNYRIERELSRQDDRVVYQGWQTALNQPVAITQLTAETAADSAFVDRWKQVARDLRAPGHPHLVRILDGDFSGEQPFLVESYLIADRLSDRLAEGWGLGDALQMWFDLADALGYIHRRGWAHGGLQADDVRVMDNGSAYLADLPWQVAQRERDDAGAMRADVTGVSALFVALRQPVAGELPAWADGQKDDLEELTQWLAQGEEQDSEDLASDLAPVLMRALNEDAEGAYPTCAELAEALRPLLQSGKPTTQKREHPTDSTIVGPPPGSLPYASSPPVGVTPPPPTPQSPTPYTTPHYASPPPPPIPYAPAPPPPPQKGGAGRWILVTVGVIAGLAIIAGVLLCMQGVLPFCASCDEALIAQYTKATKSYIERNAWGDAERELDAALAECALCSNEPVTCEQARGMRPTIACHSQTEKLTADAQVFLETGDSCQAVEYLEEAVSLGCDTKVAEALLTAKEKGAYVQCAKTLLEQETEEACILAYEYLSKAHEMKSSNLEISGHYEQAAAFWAFREAYDGEQWFEAQESLEALTFMIPGGEYCGATFDEYQYDILFGQGKDADDDNKPCEAETYYRQANTAATTMGQENESDKAVEAAATACADTWTPTPTPTLTPTPTRTPVPTPQPVVAVDRDNVKVREGPHVRHPKITSVKKDETFDVICSSKQDDGLWYNIRLSDKTGWIRGDMVEVEDKSYTQTCSSASVPAVPTRVPVRYCWTAKPLPIEKINPGLVEALAIARDANGNAKSGIRIRLYNEWGLELDGRYTGHDGGALWSGIDPIEWIMCIYPNGEPHRSCSRVKFENTGQGERARIEFRYAPCK